MSTDPEGNKVIRIKLIPELNRSRREKKMLTSTEVSAEDSDFNAAALAIYFHYRASAPKLGGNAMS